MRNSTFRLFKQFKTLITMDKIQDLKRGKKNSNHFKNIMVDAQIDSTRRNKDEK